MKPFVLTTVALVTVAAACGTSDGEPESAPSSTDVATTTSTEPPATSTSTSSTAVPTTVPELPGESVDPIFTPAGAELAAVAVAFDETLDVRELPAPDAPVLVSLAPTATGIVSTGRARLDDGAWLEVTVEGSTGWVPLNQLLCLGGTLDVTDRVVAGLDSVPTAPAALELGRTVADWFASDDEEVPSRIVVVVAPVDGGQDEVTYDVVGFPDESIGGVRLHVIGRRITLPSTGIATAFEYELDTVEQTALCLRGADDTGLCV